jgi:peptidoglycan/LPS O-acetylase OafA/YrhL
MNETILLRWFTKMDRLLILRGLAALVVVNYHSQDAFRATLRPLRALGQDFSWLFLANGGMAVRVFFALSGFLMFKAFYTDRYLLNRHHLPKFYMARIRRIVPLYYFLTLVFVVLVFPVLLRPENRAVLISIFTFTYSGNTPVPFAVPFWSLSTEVEFYILVPALVLLTRKIIKRRRHLVACFVAVVILGILSRWLTYGQSATTLINFITNLDIFLIGGLVCVGMYGLNWRDNFNANAATWITLATGVLLFPLLSLYVYVFPQYGYLLLAPTATALLTAVYIWGSEHNNTQTYSKSVYHLTETAKRPLLWPAYIGALSYGIYLWHAPILSRVQEAELIPGTGWKAMYLTFLLTTSLAVACAIWTYKFIENRAR